MNFKTSYYAVVADTGLCSMFFNCPHCKHSLKIREGIPSKRPAARTR